MSQALTFPVPAAGSLDQYIQSVNRMPMLSEQQEVDLATRLRDEGDVDAARQLATDTKAAVAITGAVDYVTDGRRVAAIENGHPLMTRVTGLGCSATAVIGAFLAVERDAFAATVAALAVFGVAGEIAAARSPGPGSLQVALLDALYLLDEATLAARLRATIR